MEKDWWKEHLSEYGKKLALSGMRIPTLEGIHLPTDLEKLWLSDTNLTSLEGVLLPQSLQQLYLRNTNLSSLEGLVFPKDLRELDLRNTKLTSLENIELPQGLEKLWLSDVLHGMVLPQNLRVLVFEQATSTNLMDLVLPLNLEMLFLHGRQLTNLEGLVLPENLRLLDLGGTSLKSIKNVSLPQSLQKLDVSHTSLTNLDGLSLPQGLESLYLGGTKITILPEFIRKLNGLEQLDLAGLKLKELPDWLPELGLPFIRDGRKNRGINLNNTTVEGVDMSIFRQSQEDILRWFEARKKQDDAPLNEIKVVFLGNGDVGKTHTIARLMRNDEKPDESFTGESTPGIAIAHKSYRIDGQDIQVHFWDFGGQDVLFPMHRMFMTERTIYVVMVDARNESRGSTAREWLDTVNSFASEAPVMLVVNKLDQNPGATLDERGLCDAYPNLENIIFMSAKKLGKQAFHKTFTAKLLELIPKN